MTLVDLLTEHDIPFRLPGQHEHARQGWIQIDCPHCMMTGHFRLGLPENGRVGNCWTCGKQTISTVLFELGVRWEHIKEFFHDTIPSHLPDHRAHRGRLVIPEGVGGLQGAHINYLVQRSLNPRQLVRFWELGGIGLSGGTLAWRIFIPIHHQGRVVSWTTRTIGDKGKRYISASPKEESVRHKSILFGFDYVRQACIVTEGPFDAMRIGPGAVATFGASYTAKQKEWLTKIPTRIICFDAEPDAQDRARKLCNDLSVYPGVTKNAVLESAKDAGAADHDEVMELRKQLKGTW